MRIQRIAAAAALLLAHRRDGQAKAFVSNGTGLRQGRVPRAATDHHHHRSANRMMSAGAEAFHCRGGLVASRFSISSFAGVAPSSFLSREQHRQTAGTGSTLGRRGERGAVSRGTTRLLSMREGGGGKGESVQNRALGTVVSFLFDSLPLQHPVLHSGGGWSVCSCVRPFQIQAVCTRRSLHTTQFTSTTLKCNSLSDTSGSPVSLIPGQEAHPGRGGISEHDSSVSTCATSFPFRTLLWFLGTEKEKMHPRANYFRQRLL